MNRCKGEKLFTAVDDYTVFDLETTGVNPLKCDIIEICALRVRNNEIVDMYHTLVNPCKHIPEAATQINHITDDMVATAPKIEDAFSDFLNFIGKDILVGHNIDTFDLNIIYDISEKLYNKPIKNSYIDTYNLSRRCLPELHDHRLETICCDLGIDVPNLHRADNDSRFNHMLYQELKHLLNTVSPCFYESKPKTKAKYQNAQVNPKSAENNIFLDKTCIVYGAFQQLSLEQTKNLLKVLGAHYIDFFCYSADYLILGDEMHKKYLTGVSDELIDSVRCQKGIVVLSEYDFCRYGDILLSENKNSADFDVPFDINGKLICLTGVFETDTRERITNRLVELGAVVTNNVKKSLNYLIVGNCGNDLWKNGSLGTKEERALYFNSKGSNIQILKENDFIKAACLNV